jgi:hypothetical protein
MLPTHLKSNQAEDVAIDAIGSLNSQRRSVMNRLQLFGVLFMFAVFVSFMGRPVDALAGEAGTMNKAEQKADQKSIETKLNDSLGMPMLKGELWLKMTHDSKVAFVWGFGHVVTIENSLMEKYPELKKDSFTTKTAEGMADMPMNDVVAKIDSFYKANPDKIEDPVTKVIWDTMIKPNIKTGIAGRPLQKQQ